MASSAGICGDQRSGKLIHGGRYYTLILRNEKGIAAVRISDTENRPDSKGSQSRLPMQAVFFSAGGHTMLQTVCEAWGQI